MSANWANVSTVTVFPSSEKLTPLTAETTLVALFLIAKSDALTASFMLSSKVAVSLVTEFWVTDNNEETTLTVNHSESTVSLAANLALFW